MSEGSKPHGGQSDLSGNAQEPSLLAEEFARLLKGLEAMRTTDCEHECEKAVRGFVRSNPEAGRLLPHAFYEELAFAFHSHDHQQPSVWGLHFGPVISGLTEAGEAFESPSLSKATPEALDYWKKRARECDHSAMRARYADLGWELPKAIDGARPDYQMAQVAVDSYLRAAEENLYDREITSAGKLRRALSIAVELNDSSRISIVRDALVDLELEVADDDKPGLWGFSFDTFVEPPHKNIPIPDEQRERLVSELEARLARLAGDGPDQYHPSGAEAAALRLAAYYRRRGEVEEVRRVLKVYSSVVLDMKGRGSSMVFSAALESLYDHLIAFGLRDEAAALNGPIRDAAVDASRELKPITVETQIPAAKIEELFDSLLAGTTEEVISRIAVHFIPAYGDSRDELLRLASDHPISFMFRTVIKDADGRSVAVVGPLDSDLDGHIVRHISQSLYLASPWLREAFTRARTLNLLTPDNVTAFVLQAPVFHPSRHSIIEAGLEAYFAGDPVTAIHVLVPQIEHAMRSLAAFIGAPTFVPRPGGGLSARTLGDLLRDEQICLVLEEDVTAYLRILLTDARGWNVRNNVCHGLASSAMLSMVMADRVVQAVCVLGMLREQGGQAE